MSTKPGQLQTEISAPWATLHSCRHYCASALIKSGVPLTFAARYMGHTIATLLKTYAHWIEDDLDSVPDVLGWPESETPKQ